MLLGSDLPTGAEGRTGWRGVLAFASQEEQVGLAEIFKVPHHGSATSQHPQVWDTLLSADPVAVVTPFAQGNVTLPNESEATFLTSRTSRAYITAAARTATDSLSPDVIAAVSGSVVWMRDSQPDAGHIRIRRKLDEAADWEVETFSGAHQLVRAAG
jgi:hypothetical protein